MGIFDVGIVEEIRTGQADLLKKLDEILVVLSEIRDTLQRS